MPSQFDLRLDTILDRLNTINWVTTIPTDARFTSETITNITVARDGLTLHTEPCPAATSPRHRESPPTTHLIPFDEPVDSPADLEDALQQALNVRVNILRLAHPGHQPLEPTPTETDQ